MELTKANGLTKAVNFSTNLSALVVFLLRGQVIIPLGIVAGLFNIAGNYIGAARFEKNGIDFKAIRISDREEAQNAPTPITTYSLFCDGKYVTNEQMNDKKFLKMVNG